MIPSPTFVCADLQGTPYCTCPIIVSPPAAQWFLKSLRRCPGHHSRLPSPWGWQATPMPCRTTASSSRALIPFTWTLSNPPSPPPGRRRRGWRLRRRRTLHSELFSVRWSGNIRCTNPLPPSSFLPLPCLWVHNTLPVYSMTHMHRDLKQSHSYTLSYVLIRISVPCSY